MSTWSALVLQWSLEVGCWPLSQLQAHYLTAQPFLFVCLWSISNLGGRVQGSQCTSLSDVEFIFLAFLYQIPFASSTNLPYCCKLLHCHWFICTEITSLSPFNMTRHPFTLLMFYIQQDSANWIGHLIWCISFS